MKICYYGDKLSPNIAKTPEGFLVCQNVPIARTGYQKYRESELIEDGDFETIVNVYRSPDEVFSQATLASFEGKPVTNGHPDVDVTPENFTMFSRGHVQHVRIGRGDDADKILADLYITDPDLIEEIQNGKREVSAGYYAEDKEDKTGRICQTCIRGNHVAVVDEGRAGRAVRIRDTKSHIEGEVMKKTTKGKALLRSLKRYYMDADPMEREEIESDIEEILDGCNRDECEEDMIEDDAPAEGFNKAESEVDGIKAKLEKLLHDGGDEVCDEDEDIDVDIDEDEDESDFEDEDEDIDIDVDEDENDFEDEDEDIDVDIDEDEDESEDYSDEGEDVDEEEEVEIIPTDETEERLSAKDAAIKKISRAASKIRNRTDRKRVQDAIRDAVRGKSQMSGLMRVARENQARRDALSSKNINVEKLQKIYDKLDPHKCDK